MALGSWPCRWGPLIAGRRCVVVGRLQASWCVRRGVPSRAASPPATGDSLTRALWDVAWQKGEVGQCARGWRAANSQVLCRPPLSVGLPSRNGRLVQTPPSRRSRPQRRRWGQLRPTLVAMPAYEFRCRACGQTFTENRPMSASGDPATCPAGHDDTIRLLTTLGSVTSGSAPSAGGGGCCGGGCCST